MIWSQGASCGGQYGGPSDRWRVWPHLCGILVLNLWVLISCSKSALTVPCLEPSFSRSTGSEGELGKRTEREDQVTHQNGPDARWHYVQTLHSVFDLHKSSFWELVETGRWLKTQDNGECCRKVRAVAGVDSIDNLANCKIMWSWCYEMKCAHSYNN